MNKKWIFILVILAIGIGFFYFYNASEKPDVPDETIDETITEEPYMRGEIYSISGNQILIAEGSRGKDYAGEMLEENAIWVTVGEKTEIMDGEKNNLQVGDLKTGLKAEVWVKGLILYSHPAQGTAHKIIILGENEEKLVKECFVGGCSGELCTDDPEAMSTCELLPGMECLGEGMSCQLVDNQCAWVLSQEAAQCFLEVENEYGEQVRNTRIGHLFEKAEEKIKGN